VKNRVFTGFMEGYPLVRMAFLKIQPGLMIIHFVWVFF